MDTETLHQLNMAILLLTNHRDSFKESQVGFSEAQKSIDFLKGLTAETSRLQGLRLSDLCAISNNSRLTNTVLNSLNEKLDDREIRDFREWLLRCVNQ